MSTAAARGFGWIAIVRLGLVQAAIGAIVMLATSLLNRVMVVEYALAAAIPAGLVAWHYAVQLARPLWGHGSDRGRKRTPWIGGGMAVLAGGALLAVRATTLMPGSALVGLTLAGAFCLVGALFTQVHDPTSWTAPLSQGSGVPTTSRRGCMRVMF